MDTDRAVTYYSCLTAEFTIHVKIHPSFMFKLTFRKKIVGRRARLGSALIYCHEGKKDKHNRQKVDFSIQDREDSNSEQTFS